MTEKGVIEIRNTKEKRRISLVVWALVIPIINVEQAFFGPPPLDGITQLFALVAVIPGALTGYLLAQILTKYVLDPASNYVDFGFPTNRFATASVLTIAFVIPCALIVFFIDGSTVFQICVVAFAMLIMCVEATIRTEKPNKEILQNV